MPPTRRTHRGLVVASLLAATTLVPACGIGNRKPFRDAFPDPAVLVTTTEPERVLAQLAEVDLPQDRAHHDQLLALLRRESSISAAHLALLTRAVALPEQIVCSTGDGRWSYPLRGQADNSAFVDQLIAEGAEKLRDVDRRWFGELIGMTQSDTLLLLLAERWMPQIDDGSDRALDEVLAGMPGSPARLPFFTQYLGPQGRLDGERGWHAFAQLSFDSERSALLAALVARDPAIDGQRLLAVMKAYSFDSGREQAFALLTTKVGNLEADTTCKAIATFSFDSGRQAAFASLAKSLTIAIDDAQLLQFVTLCSFDSGRIDCIKTLAPCLRGDASARDARNLLAAFSFDADRLQAVQLMAPRWINLPVDDRRALLETFSFDSSRQQALKALMR